MREIRRKGSGGAATFGETEKVDDYLTRLVKYIPAESVALWVALYGIVTGASADIPVEIVTWLIFVALIVLTPLYLWRIGKIKNGMQIAISTFAFIVWVFALGGPFALYAWYSPIYGALLLPIVTFAIPILQGSS